MIYLQPLSDVIDIEIWSDAQLEPGIRWKEEIESVLSNFDIAILLVSPEYLASSFIVSWLST